MLIAQSCLTLCDPMDCSPQELQACLPLRPTNVYRTHLCSLDPTKVKVAQSCPTLQLHGCSPPGSSVHRILLARILKWVAILFFRGSSQPRYQTWVSCTTGRLFIIWLPGKPSNMAYLHLKGIIWCKHGQRNSPRKTESQKHANTHHRKKRPGSTHGMENTVPEGASPTPNPLTPAQGRNSSPEILGR